MQTTNVINRYVVARDRNVLRVDFSRDPDPPAPCFPGAGALRKMLWEESEEAEGEWRAPLIRPMRPAQANYGNRTAPPSRRLS